MPCKEAEVVAEDNLDTHKRVSLTNRKEMDKMNQRWWISTKSIRVAGNLGDPSSFRTRT